jgi:uncharacterized OsmC-like protein
MTISAIIKSQFNQLQTSIQTNDASKEIHIAPKPTGYGSSVNGGELLMLSLAICYCNDIYREAAKRNIDLSNVEVEFTSEFGSEGEPGFNFKYKVHVDAKATASEIENLIQHTDKVAEIHNTLRKGLPITLIR